MEKTLGQGVTRSDGVSELLSHPMACRVISCVGSEGSGPPCADIPENHCGELLASEVGLHIRSSPYNTVSWEEALCNYKKGNCM